MSRPCKLCGKNGKIWAKGLCRQCDKIANPEKYKIRPKLKPPANNSSKNNTMVSYKGKSLKGSKFKPTGELELFRKIYTERGMKCELTGRRLEFNINCFAHILSKGAFPAFRLYKPNIIMVQERVHHLYDNSTKEKLLAEFPQAVKIYEAKDKLRYEYYNNR